MEENNTKLKEEIKALQDKVSDLEDYIKEEKNTKLKRNLVRYVINIIKLTGIYNPNNSYEPSDKNYANLKNIYDIDYYKLDSRYEMCEWRYPINKEEQTYRCHVLLDRLKYSPDYIIKFITDRLHDKGAKLYKYLEQCKSVKVNLNPLVKENIDFEWE